MILVFPKNPAPTPPISASPVQAACSSARVLNSYQVEALLEHPFSPSILVSCLGMATSSSIFESPAHVIKVSSSGPQSGAAERCLMHLHRMQSAPNSSLASYNHILVQHDEAHAIIVVHVDSASFTPVVGGGIVLDCLHCTAQVMRFR
jgi:hypothetical protein